MDKTLAQLEEVLRDELRAHERLLDAMNQKLEAMRSAAHERMVDCCREENAALQSIGEYEKKRLNHVAELTLAIDPKAAAPLRMGALAERLPEPARGRVLVLRQQLLERMQQVRERSGSLRRAADMLVAHVQGLMQTIGGALSNAGTYGRRGAVPRATMRLSTFSATG